MAKSLENHALPRDTQPSKKHQIETISSITESVHKVMKKSKDTIAVMTD